MVEVFETNVTHHLEASWLVNHIHNSFTHYKANFDLDDCDSILRVEASGRAVQPEAIINLLKESGFDAQVLPDDYPPEPEAGYASGARLFRALAVQTFSLAASGFQLGAAFQQVFICR
jgi:hypothetical protein